MRVRATLTCWCLAALGVVGVVAGCARKWRGPAADDAASTRMTVPTAEIEVVVENHNSADVTVMLQGAGGRRVRLGTVSGSATRTLRFPGELAAASQPLALLAHPIGGRETYVSDRFTVQPGQQVVLTVASRVGQSSVAVH